MRHALVASAALLIVAASLRAQVADSRRAPLPAAQAAEIARLYNGSAALRAIGEASVPAGETIAGDVAVLNGPLTVGGHVTGRVLVINGNAILRDGATIDGDLIVVGGQVTGQERATIGGEVQRYVQALHYHIDGDRIVPDADGAAGAEAKHDRDEENREEGWLHRLRRHRETGTLTPLVYGGPYNRVEGMPIEIGPSFRAHTDRARIRVDALGVFRTVDNFRWDPLNLGHDVNAELQLGQFRRLAVGGRLYDVVDATERWQLRDSEVGLASFFFHRDYRDYYNRHGGSGFVTVSNGHGVDLTAELAEEVWEDRRDRSPWTLFSEDATWRVNPFMDQGHFHIGTATLKIDTRSDPDDPRTGWYIVMDVEHGTSNAVRLAPTSPFARDNSAAVQPVQYTRGMIDLRRYNRVSPIGQLNFRVVLGGWLGGDELPLQRRFSLGGAGTLPGFDFRRVPSGRADVFQCGDGSVMPGAPAQCERIALAQAEYRGNLPLHLHGHGDIDDWLYEIDRGSQWVVFGDMGRGWLVGPRAGALRYENGTLPPLNTFEGDVGVGLDFNFIGFFLAKPISQLKQPVNFFVRLKHRF
ncbi:MAG: BamA/TamA family outer membrane protein [Gemmatimonadota bacterium]|nr:BamA/TamA family outer membrane protein [Gemmatimonadota bacterium]